MKIQLLRSKMALKGDYDLICLVAVTGLSKGSVINKCDEKTSWTVEEIRKIAKYYDLSDEEIISIFELNKGD